MDLQEAFYRVVRELVVAGPIDDQATALMTSRLQLGDDCLHELYAELAKPHALREAHVPDHMQRAIKALHADTFFQLPLQQDCVVTQIGSRPGDSCADVIYGYLMAKVMEKFQMKMEAQGVLPNATRTELGPRS